MRCWLQTIESKFSEFQLNVDAGAERVAAVSETASRLIDQQNPSSAVILEKQEHLRSVAWRRRARFCVETEIGIEFTTTNELMVSDWRLTETSGVS